METIEELFVKHEEQERAHLKATFPEIRRIESLEELKNLTLVSRRYVGKLTLLLEYEATAPTFFPAVRQRLIDSGVAKRRNILYTQLKNKGTPEEIYNVTMGFYGYRLQISLDVHR